MAAKIMLRVQIMSWLEKHRANGDPVDVEELFKHFPSTNWGAFVKALSTLESKRKVTLSKDGATSDITQVYPPYAWRASSMQRKLKEDK